MTAAPKSPLCGSCFAEIVRCAKLVVPMARPLSFGKKRVSTGGTPRGKGPGDSTRIAEITSGRSTCQQGLTATCKDVPHKAYKLRRCEAWGLAHGFVVATTAG
jgi:hypothetical protein